MNSSHPMAEVPRLELDGPDYMTLVIEWNDGTDNREPSVALVRTAPRQAAPGTLATVLGALGAIALATWGLHRLTRA